MQEKTKIRKARETRVAYLYVTKKDLKETLSPLINQLKT